MRIGLAEQTVLAALAQAAVMQEEPCVSQADLPSRLDEAQKVMKEAYHLLPVVELLVKAILEGASPPSDLNLKALSHIPLSTLLRRRALSA